MIAGQEIGQPVGRGAGHLLILRPQIMEGRDFLVSV